LTNATAQNRGFMSSLVFYQLLCKNQNTCKRLLHQTIKQKLLKIGSSMRPWQNPYERLLQISYQKYVSENKLRCMKVMLTLEWEGL